jgi:hypothetical protein
MREIVWEETLGKQAKTMHGAFITQVTACLAYSLILKIEIERVLRRSVNFCKVMRRNVSEKEHYLYSYGPG